MARSSPRATRSSTRLTMPSTKPASAMSKTKTSPSSDTSSVKPMTKPTPAPTSSLKRKRPSAPTEETLKPSPATKTSALATLEDGDADDQESSSKSAKKQKKKQEEKRPRMFRRKAPQSFLEKLERAQTQRMIVIGRARSEKDGLPTEDIDIVGSTGNIYRVTIDKQTSCTCPDSRKGNECKHKVYALHTVLKAPANLVYQLGLLSTELREIFKGAPPIPTEAASAEDNDGKRKPIDGECPICYFDLDEKENELVWCTAACGNNMHKSCFEQWAASQRGQTVKCVYCRTPWEMDKEDADKIKKMGSVNSEGYVNVADHFGMSSVRDYSSYHQPWVRRSLGMGW